jgi:glycoside/pentoside/hexuronide:cation symporter, GPH family
MSGVHRPIEIADTAAYAAGSFATGVFSTVPAILLLYFCTEILHVRAIWAAAIVFVPKVWAIAWDPSVGVWSDGAATRIGRRRPFLIAGAAGVAIAFILVFSPPRLPEAATAVWMAVTYFLLATLYSIFAVPYIAVPSELPVTAPKRASLVTWRMVIAMVGVLVGAGLVPHIVALSGGGRPGYARMSLIVAGACGVAMLLPVWMLRGRDRASSKRVRATGAWHQLGAVLRERAFVWLSGSYVLQLTAVGIVSATAPYLVTGAFGRGEADIGTAMIGMLGASTLSMPLWAWVGRRFGAARILAAAVVLFGGGAILIGALALASANWTLAKVAFALTGIPFAGMQVLPYMLVAQLVHECAREGQAGESSFTGVWTAAEKLGLALGPALTGIVLAFSQAAPTRAVGIFVLAAPLILGLVSLPVLTSVSRVRAATCATRVS